MQGAHCTRPSNMSRTLRPSVPASFGLSQNPGVGREVTSLSFETLGQEEPGGEAEETRNL